MTKWMFLVLFVYSCAGKEMKSKVVAAPVRNITQDSLKRFVSLSSNKAVGEVNTELNSLLSSVQKDSVFFVQAVNYLSKPFSDPNSPFRNEDLFIVILKAELASPWYSDLEREVISGKLQLAMQNRPGKSANDFTYLTPEGSKKRLYGLHATYTLLYFYNPECHACMEMKKAVESSSIIGRNLRSGRLKLLAIYTDTDEGLWRRHLHENAANWINGRDTNEYLWRNKLYDLRAIPTLYLLDSTKTVLLKDANLHLVENVLQ